MDPPPLPALARFRLRVEVVAPQDGRDVSAHPLCKFTIVKTAAIPLPDLTLRQLRQEVVKRFKSMYPDRPLFTIDRSQDSLGFDIHLDDLVRDVFADLDVLRVIQGETFRASVEPHRSRSASVQPIEFPKEESLIGHKRPIEYSSIHPYSQPEKRRRTSNLDADRPIHSCERDLDAQEEGFMGESLQHATVVQDSQGAFASQGQQQSRDGHVQVQSSLPVLEVSESVRKIGGSYKDVKSPNVFTKAAAQLQHVSPPLSTSSSKSGALTSGSDAQLRNAKATTSPNRSLLPYGERNDADRLESTSTAVTTPPSAGLQLNPSLPAFDNNKLKRLNLEAAQGTDSVRKAPREVPRKDIYSDIETDQERPTVKRVRPIGGKGLSKLQQPSPPAGVSKKALVQKGTSSDDGSPHLQRGDVINGKHAGQGDADRSREEQQRLDQEHQDAVDFAQQKAEEQRRLVMKATEDGRLAALESRRQKDAKAKELQATVRRAAENRAKVANNAEEKAREKAREGAHAKTIAASKVKAEFERQHQIQLEVEANKKREEDKLQAKKLNPTGRSRLRDQQSVKTPSKPSTIHPNGILPIAAAANEHNAAGEANPEPRAIIPKSITPQSALASKARSSTPYILQGRPSGSTSAAMFSSQTVGSSSPVESSPGRRIETPGNRKVSFVEPQSQPRSARKSSTLSSSLTQTTLVPPHLGFTDVKSTPKRNSNKAALNGSEPSKSNKGKAKVVESPAKPANEVIVISDDESNAGSDTDLSSLGYNEDDFIDIGEPGPAYREKSSRRSTRNPKSKVDGRSPKETAILPRKRTPPPYPKAIKVEMESSPEPILPRPAESSSQVLRGRPSSRGLRSHAISYSPIRPPGTEAEAAAFHASSSQPQGASHAKRAAVRLNDIITGVETGNSNSSSNAIEEDETSEDEKSKQGEGSESEEGAEDETIENDQVMTDSEDPAGDKSEEDEISDDDADDGDFREESHAMQEELDKQLLLQANRPVSTREKRPDISTEKSRSKAIDENAEQLRSLSAKMPSLRRMAGEAERTKEADMVAARERGIAKAQKEKDNARLASGMNGTEDDSTDLTSSASEDDDDDDTDEAEADNVPKTRHSVSTGRKTTESSRSTSELLGSEDIEDVRKQLQPKMNGRFSTSSQKKVDPRLPQVSGGSGKAILPPQNQKPIGFAKLNQKIMKKRFSAGNKSSPRG